MRTIILADNQDISNVGLCFLLKNIAEQKFIHEVTKKEELIQLLITFPNSLVILDYMLFDFESITELLILQLKFEKTDWILFSDELSDNFLQAILFNNQSFSILMKCSTKDEIISAIKEALKGNRYICNHVSHILLDNNKSIKHQNVKYVLTITEQKILKEMSLGRTTKEIALNRRVSIHTIVTHRKNIFKKIDVNNIHDATKYAIHSGIVEMTEFL